jgi:hypothetical protein
LLGYYSIFIVPNAIYPSFNNANREKGGKYAKTGLFRGDILMAARQGGKIWHKHCAIGR